MQTGQELQWLYLDLNSYFASVEQQENPRLRGRPVAVVPSDTPHTCAIAASYEAKAYGVKTGTIIRDARRMCPGLICVPARHDIYVRYHNRILSEVIKHTPINTVWSIDEFDSRLPPSKRNETAVRAIAARIKHGLRENIGESVRCSIGVAPSSLLAKIATDMQKPDGLVILKPDELPGRLLNLSLTDLPGIGVNMQARLHRAGIHSVEQFWNTSPKQARKIWGSVQGERFWYRLHGYDLPLEETDRSVIGHSRVLDPALRHAEGGRLMTRRLLVKATHRLRRQNLYARHLALKVTIIAGEYNDLRKWYGDCRFPAACDPFTFLQHLDDLWQEMRHYTARIYHLPEPRFKKVSIALSGFYEQEQITADLFDTCQPENAAKLAKHEALAKALDSLQARYQKETVTLGLPPKTLSGYVGTKIAFSRVPDEEEFWG